MKRRVDGCWRKVPGDQPGCLVAGAAMTDGRCSSCGQLGAAVLAKLAIALGVVDQVRAELAVALKERRDRW